MINTFWNLCRACPIPAESKLHAEYKRNFAWQPEHTEPAGYVVVKPPDATWLEPSLARKKRHPEVAYRTSDILNTDEGHHPAAGTGSAEALHRDGNDHCYRARPGERTNKSKVGSRSRSADPSLGRGRPVMSKEECCAEGPMNGGCDGACPESHGDEAPCKTSEYRAAFAWPPKPSLPPATKDAVDGPHRAEPTERLLPRDDACHEVKKTAKRTEYKAKFKPFSSYMYVDGSWKKPKAVMSEALPVVDPNQWYAEVVERLHMADEYRIRSRAGALQTGGPSTTHGTTLWAKLDSSASLAALALAHTPRPVSAKTAPRERPAPASIHRSQSAKRREKTDTEAGRTTDSSEKKSPTKAVSPVKAEAGNQRKASPAAKPPATARQKQTSPKTPAKHDDDGAKTAASSRTRAASSPPQRRTPMAETDKKDDKKTGASRPRRPLQESAAPPAAKPRAVVRPASAAVNEQDGKIWLKPQGKTEGEEVDSKQREVTGKAEDAGGSGEDSVLVPPATTPAESVEAATPGSGSERKSDAVRPSSLPPMNGSSASSSALASADMASPSPLPEPQSGPVPLTTVKSPEEVTGVKSPDPETWTVPLDTGRGLEWTDGQSPAGDWPGKAKGTTSAPIIDTAPKPAPAPKMESAIPEGKVDPIQKAAPEESPHKAGPEDPVKPQPAGQTGVDVLDKARNRLEEFWVTGK
ncbi:uncharacterized protein LOC144098942 isoform X6 [Amblyomma americanum]